MNITEQKRTHRYREQSSGYQWGEGGIDWQFGIDMYTLLYLKLIINKDLLYKNFLKILKSYVLLTTFKYIIWCC